MLAIKLRHVLSGSAVFSLASSFAARATTAGLMFLLVALAARELSLQSFGEFSLLYSVGGMFALIAAGGQQLLVMRAWNEFTAAQDSARFKGALVFSGFLLGLGVALMAAAVFGILAYWYPVAVAASVTTYLVGLALVTTTGHLVRAAIGVEAGDGLASVMTLAPPISYLVLQPLLGGDAGLAELFSGLSLGALVTAAIHLHMLRKRIKAVFPGISATRAQIDWSVWLKRSARLWLFNALEATNQFLDVLLLGILLNPTAAGAYFVLTRLANIFVIASGAVQLYASRHITREFYRRDFGQLAHHLDVVASGCAVLVPLGLLAVWLVGPYVLELFGSEYALLGRLLLLLSLGTGSILAAGASGMLLTFTGREGWTAGVLGATVAGRLIGFAVLVPSLQIVGAALVSSLSFVAMSAALALLATRLTGFDGSVFRLTGRVLGHRRAVSAERS